MPNLTQEQDGRSLSLYDIESGLLALFREREELLASSPDLLPAEIEQQVSEKDEAIREYVKAEIQKADGIAYTLREFEARAAVKRKEAKRITMSAAIEDARYERLEATVIRVMQMMGKKAFAGQFNTLKLKANPPSVDDDIQIDLLPDKFKQRAIVLNEQVYQSLLAALERTKANPTAQSFANALRLGQKEVVPRKADIAAELKKQELCEKCGGNGLLRHPGTMSAAALQAGAESETCDGCHGTGKVSGVVAGARLVTDTARLSVE